MLQSVAKAIEIAGGVFTQDEIKQLQDAFAVVDQEYGQDPIPQFKDSSRKFRMEPWTKILLL